MGLPEEVEGSLGSEAALEEHAGEGLVGGVLADEVHGHGDGGADGTDAQREQLTGVELATILMFDKTGIPYLESKY